MKLFVAVMFITVSVAFAEDLPNPVPAPGKESQPIQNPSTNENQKTDQPNTVSQELSSPHNLQISAPVGEPDIHNPSTPPSQSSSDDRIVWLTAGLLIVTFAQACIYFRQARLMRQGLEITRVSNEAAQKSAAAALKSAEVAEAALKITQRAYLQIQWEKPNIFTAGGNIRFSETCVVINGGQTPATIFLRLHGCAFGERIPDPIPQTQSFDSPQTNVQVAAHGRLPISLSPLEGVTPTIYSAIKEGVMVLYAFIRVDYRDEFSQMHQLASWVQYDPQKSQMMIIDKEGYNYSS